MGEVRLRSNDKYEVQTSASGMPRATDATGDMSFVYLVGKGHALSDRVATDGSNYRVCTVLVVPARDVGDAVPYKSKLHCPYDVGEVRLRSNDKYEVQTSASGMPRATDATGDRKEKSIILG